ncbi:Biopolymer transport protein ExbD/TolR [Verrucomicrobia bacterium]|nr:Biopolymer transport protein ExbD/TolR [Verrucomicrobiota bacterium]
MKGLFEKVRRPHHGSLTELNITPLLDLVFVLLVIFIITTPQMTHSLEVNLPSAKAPPKPDAGKPKINRVRVDEKGQPFLNGVALTLPTLKTKLQQLKAAEPALGVVVECSDEAEYQNMVDVLDILQQLEITKVGLATESAPPPGRL